jgi:hypothetical protein
MASKYMKKNVYFSHQGKTIQNCTEIPSHPSQNDYYQENPKQQMFRKMWGKKDPDTLFVGMLLSPVTIEVNMEVPQNSNNRTMV